MPFETPDLVPSTETVPERVERDGFALRPLTVEDTELDYAAVTTSRERLQGVFYPGDTWPAGLTVEQNRIDLAWHQKEHQRRDAFTYAVVDESETAELGCVYVQPTRVEGYDVAVYYWVSTAGVERGLADAIEATIRQWLADDWPLDSVAYPGRDIDWADWPLAGN